jgi:beta-N-acetylhexosaminidase
MKPPAQSVASDLLMLRLVGPRWSSLLERQVRALAPGAILLAGTLPRSPEALCELLAGISRCLPAPPILAIEEEGGNHDPLSVVLPPLPSPQSIGQKGPGAARLAGELIGEALKLLGLNTNLAPLLDLAPAHVEAVASTRTFSSDPGEVRRCGWFWVEGHARHKILSCAKHFPGLASALAAPEELPVSGRSMAELWGRDLIPYRELLPRLPMVMLSNAVYKAYDFNHPRPAALSAQIVEGLLRVKLRYQGVVVAPGLEDSRIRGALDLSGAAVEAINVGCDFLLVEEEASGHAMRKGLEQALESGRLCREKFDRACGRIHAARQQLSPPSGQLAKGAWNRLTRRFAAFNLAL